MNFISQLSEPYKSLLDLPIFVRYDERGASIVSFYSDGIFLGSW
jgi:hypothetical protein